MVLSKDWKDEELHLRSASQMRPLKTYYNCQARKTTIFEPLCHPAGEQETSKLYKRSNFKKTKVQSTAFHFREKILVDRKVLNLLYNVAFFWVLVIIWLLLLRVLWPAIAAISVAHSLVPATILLQKKKAALLPTTTVLLQISIHLIYWLWQLLSNILFLNSNYRLCVIL